MFKINKKGTRMTPGVWNMWNIVKYFIPCSNVSIVNFEHVIAGKVMTQETLESSAKTLTGRKSDFSVGSSFLWTGSIIFQLN